MTSTREKVPSVPRAGAAGDPAAGVPGDPGLFGPDSVVWRVHADPSMALGGLRALLLQAVHPLVFAGFEEHSNFRQTVWPRLQRTARYVGVTTYGTTAEAEELGATVRRIHRGMGGIDPESQQPYRVDDPHLLRWVHVCEAESFLSTYRRSGGVLHPGEADQYYREMQRAAALIGCDDVPDSEQAVDDYFRAIRPELRVSPAARRGALFMLTPPLPTWVAYATPARPAWFSLAALSFALLPRWARRLYRLPALASTDLAATLTARTLRATLQVGLPPGWREGPALQAARARLGV